MRENDDQRRDEETQNLEKYRQTPAAEFFHDEGEENWTPKTENCIHRHGKVVRRTLICALT